ncbi:Uncharacterised protein [Serratia quinivorans]|uniref:Uncharacterized protein n=1 Tax=Serratia quinivorans TaxID=137545 RepID=A0A380AVN1_9GAMM|nr:hypothetical protein [Serratia proteamaculans]RYM60181.1 hypothetical protein BSR03_17205 [Serratia proteamaculans]SUI88277.1 Uncharacterised protein [Serratia quinivorans]
MKAALAVTEIAQICYAGVSALREATGGGNQPEWVDLEPDKQGVIIDYITQLLTGRAIPDSHEGEVIRRIIAVVRDDKKALKYA